ncbi:MAG: DUF4860 domain-containing protein [Clostridia bacterium]|nr:DUF4860 domain-containing protein [Clostridia bacterium]
MNGKRRSVQHSMQGVFVFVLLGLFAVMSTLMVLLGAQMYRGTVERATLNNEDRVLGAYVRSMVRAQDAAQAVGVEAHGGVKALALRETLGEDGYVTWLYCYDGQLYEQFTGDDGDFSPLSGTAICPALGFEPRLEGGLLTVDMINAKGEPETVRVALRCVR